MRYVASFLFLLPLLLSGVSTPAQKPQPSGCSIKLEQSPTVRGLKLGQPLNAVQKLFEKDSDDEASLLDIRMGLRPTNDIGVREQTVYGYGMVDSERLQGVSRIELECLDNVLASFTVHYDSSVRWQSQAHFAAAIAEQLQLPSSGWEDYRSPRLKCEGFIVKTSYYGLAALTIEHSDLRTEVSKRRAEREQMKRVEFKP